MLHECAQLDFNSDTLALPAFLVIISAIPLIRRLFLSGA